MRLSFLEPAERACTEADLAAMRALQAQEPRTAGDAA